MGSLMCGEYGVTTIINEPALIFRSTSNKHALTLMQYYDLDLNVNILFKRIHGNVLLLFVRVDMSRKILTLITYLFIY